jgi:membrane protein EpsK
MVAYTRRAIRFVGLAIALPTGIICGFADPLLRVWLHRSPQYWDLGWLMVLLTLHLSFNLGYLPLSNINIATNHVRIPGIVQVVAGLLNLALGLILVLVFGWGMYGVAAAGAIVLTLRNVIFTPLYTAHVLEQPPTIFLREVLPITALTVALGAGCWLLAHNISLFSWPRLIAAGIGVAIVYAGVVYLILGRDDRQAAIRLIARRRAPSGTSSPEPQI